MHNAMTNNAMHHKQSTLTDAEGMANGSHLFLSLRAHAARRRPSLGGEMAADSHNEDSMVPWYGTWSNGS